MTTVKIPERYQLYLPKYRYENQEMAIHFHSVGAEMDMLDENMKVYRNQGLLPLLGESGLDNWEYLYFGEKQTGTVVQRRRKLLDKILTDRAFTIANLQGLGRSYGNLTNILEDFDNKTVILEFTPLDTLDPFDYVSLEAAFERMRPIHVAGLEVRFLTPVNERIYISSTAEKFQVRFPYAGTFVSGQGIFL